MKNQETQTLRQLARSWNNLDTCFIENELAEDCVYESQWALIPVEGKVQLLTYLNSKFNAIKLVMMASPMSITAELASHPSIQNKPCIVLTQITIEGIRQVSILIKLMGDKIIRIDICFIPDPSEAELTGEFPK